MRASSKPTAEHHRDYSNWNGMRILAFVAAISGCSCAAVALGFWMGSDRGSQPLPEILAGSAVSGDTMAVATGRISDEAEAIFFLDFITGDLQCLLFYPRSGAFGARYTTNVLANLGGGGKNSKYLMITGELEPPGSSGNTRLGASLVLCDRYHHGCLRRVRSTLRPDCGVGSPAAIGATILRWGRTHSKLRAA